MTTGSSLERLREDHLSRATVFAGRLLSVHRDQVRLPDGGSAGLALAGLLEVIGSG